MRITSIRDIAVAVRVRRLAAGLSQASLARRAGVSRKWIYEFEAGKPTAELGLMLRVLEALDLELDLSRGGEGLRPQQPDTDLDALLAEYRDSAG